MKKYKFKLNALLKVRKLKEETCKMDIGRIRVKITELTSEIEKQNEGIRDAYESQEKGLEKGMSGQELQFHPYFVRGKSANIKMLQLEIEQLETEATFKYAELKILRANTKVIEKMKDKDFQKHKKEVSKKQFQEIEEQAQNWKQFIK